MTATGFTKARAATHDRYIKIAVDVLRREGHQPTELPVDGHRPDIRLGNGDYLDIKTAYAENENLAIEVNSLQQYWRIQLAESCRVYIVHAMSAPTLDWWVLLPETLKIVQGPIAPTGNGSADDWYLFHPGNLTGSRFTDFFRARSAHVEQAGMF